MSIGLVLTKWSSQSSMDISMPFSQAPGQGRAFKSILVGPLTQRLGNAIHSDLACFARVISLLTLGCPPTIFRRIPLIIVTSFQSVMGRWARTHISKELSKVMPSWHDKDTSTSITSIKGLLRNIATTHHGFPYTIFRESRPPMGGQSPLPDLSFQTATTVRCSCFQRTSCNVFDGSATTLAKKHYCSFLIWSSTQNEQATESLTSKIEKWTHSVVPFIKGHQCGSGCGVMSPTGMAIPCHSERVYDKKVYYESSKNTTKESHALCLVS